MAPQNPQTENRDFESRAALAILLLVLLVQAVALAPELSAARYRSNDGISHMALIHGMVDAVERGDSPLDFWSAETSLRLPLARWYQPLAHLAMTASVGRKAYDTKTVSVRIEIATSGRA